jgi:maltose O-acetyltransferase
VSRPAGSSARTEDAIGNDSERERMLAGELYDPFDPELVAARTRARDLCRLFNASGDSETAERQRILGELIGAVAGNLMIQPPFFCDYGSNIGVGRNCFFNFNCVVLDVCEVTLGDHVLLGPAVQLYTATHPLDAVARRAREFGRPVAIGDDVWIGGGAIVCPGVSIGARTVIGAGSVVTRDIPADVFAAGNPCRVVRRLDGG